MSFDRDQLPQRERALLEIGRVTVAFAAFDHMLGLLLELLVGPWGAPGVEWKDTWSAGSKLKHLDKAVKKIEGEEGAVERIKRWSADAWRATDERNKTLKSLMLYSDAGPLRRGPLLKSDTDGIEPLDVSRLMKLTEELDDLAGRVGVVLVAISGAGIGVDQARTSEVRASRARDRIRPPIRPELLVPPQRGSNAE